MNETQIAIFKEEKDNRGKTIDYRVVYLQQITDPDEETLSGVYGNVIYSQEGIAPTELVNNLKVSLIYDIDKQIEELQRKKELIFEAVGDWNCCSPRGSVDRIRYNAEGNNEEVTDVCSTDTSQLG